jgi:hypothetical protein
VSSSGSSGKSGVCSPFRLGRIGRSLNWDVKPSMNLSVSRVLSFVVLAADCVRAWSIPSGFGLVILIFVPLLALIWFPEQIDDLTYGAWYRGYQIDSHTPGVAIAALGWFILLLVTGILFLGRLSAK